MHLVRAVEPSGKPLLFRCPRAGFPPDAAFSGFIDRIDTHRDDETETALRNLDEDNITRAVIGTPDAPYFGARLADDTLLPRGAARLGTIGYADWLASQSPR